MALVLEHRLVPGPPRGVFRSCTVCLQVYARAGGDRRHLNRRAYRMLAREIVRLRALVPPELREPPAPPPSAMEERRAPALPRNIGEAAERTRRERTATGGAGA